MKITISDANYPTVKFGYSFRTQERMKRGWTFGTSTVSSQRQGPITCQCSKAALGCIKRPVPEGSHRNNSRAVRRLTCGRNKEQTATKNTLIRCAKPVHLSFVFSSGCYIRFWQNCKPERLPFSARLDCRRWVGRFESQTMQLEQNWIELNQQSVVVFIMRSWAISCSVQDTNGWRLQSVYALWLSQGHP